MLSVNDMSVKGECEKDWVSTDLKKIGQIYIYIIFFQKKKEKEKSMVKRLTVDQEGGKEHT